MERPVLTPLTAGRFPLTDLLLACLLLSYHRCTSNIVRKTKKMFRPFRVKELRRSKKIIIIITPKKRHHTPIVPLVYNILVAPVAYQVICEPGIGQFREFEPPRAHSHLNSKGLFLVHKLTCGKRESVS